MHFATDNQLAKHSLHCVAVSLLVSIVVAAREDSDSDSISSLIPTAREARKYSKQKNLFSLVAGRGRGSRGGKRGQRRGRGGRRGARNGETGESLPTEQEPGEYLPPAKVSPRDAKVDQPTKRSSRTRSKREVEVTKDGAGDKSGVEEAEDTAAETSSDRNPEPTKRSTRTSTRSGAVGAASSSPQVEEMKQPSTSQATVTPSLANPPSEDTAGVVESDAPATTSRRGRGGGPTASARGRTKRSGRASRQQPMNGHDSAPECETPIIPTGAQDKLEPEDPMDTTEGESPDVTLPSNRGKHVDTKPHDTESHEEKSDRTLCEGDVIATPTQPVQKRGRGAKVRGKGSRGKGSRGKKLQTPERSPSVKNDGELQKSGVRKRRGGGGGGSGKVVCGGTGTQMGSSSKVVGLRWGGSGTQMGRQWDSDGAAVGLRWGGRGTRMGRQGDSDGAAMGLGWGGRGTRMGRQWDSDGAAVGLRWGGSGAQMGRQWGSDGAAVGLRWGGSGTQMGRQWDSDGAAVGLRWGSRGTRMGRQWGSDGAAVGLRWGGSGTQMGRQWDSDGAAVGLRWGGSGTQMGRQWDSDGAAVGLRWGLRWGGSGISDGDSEMRKVVCG